MLKLKKILASILAWPLAAGMFIPLAGQKSIPVQNSSKPEIQSFEMTEASIQNIPDFSNRALWSLGANSNDVGQSSWYTCGALNQLYGTLPGVELFSGNSSKNFNNLGSAAEMVSNLLKRWGPNNLYGNPVYFISSDVPEAGGIFSTDNYYGQGHSGLILSCRDQDLPIIFEGNFDLISNGFDYASKRDWMVTTGESLESCPCTFAIPTGLAKELAENRLNSGLYVEKRVSEESEHSLYNSRLYLDNTLQAWPADGDKVYPDLGFLYTKAPMDCSDNRLLKKVLYYGIDGIEDRLSSLVPKESQAKYMNELVQAASFNGDRSHTCYSYMMKEYNWDLQKEQDDLFNKLWSVVTSDSLPEPPEDYKIYVLESDEQALRPAMWDVCKEEPMASEMIGFGPVSRLVFGYKPAQGSISLDLNWMDGDPALGGKEIDFPQDQKVAVTLLENGQETGMSQILDSEHPQALFEDLLAFNPATLKVNKYTLKQNSSSNLSFVSDLPLEEESITLSKGDVHKEVTNTLCDLSFEDVSGKDYFFYPVLWAAEEQITSGKKNGLFDPKAGCSRAEAMTFFYRLSGKPSAKELSSSFEDVPKEAYFYEPINWGVSKGLTTGKSADCFDPGAACTRAEFVTFLYRYADPSEVSFSNAFVDVNPEDYYAKAISWAVQNGITTGTGNTFNPNGLVNRGQAVTFLYRYFKAFVFEPALEKESQDFDGSRDQIEEKTSQTDVEDSEHPSKEEALI